MLSPGRGAHYIVASMHGQKYNLYHQQTLRITLVHVESLSSPFFCLSNDVVCATRLYALQMQCLGISHSMISGNHGGLFGDRVMMSIIIPDGRLETVRARLALNLGRFAEKPLKVSN